MAKASAFTTTGTLNPAADYLPYLKWNGLKFVNCKLTPVNAGIQQPDYVARSAALAAQAQANAATDAADTALELAWFGTSAAVAADGVATAALTTSWTGTSTAHQSQAVATTALSTAWTGTSLGHEAYDVAKTALETSWLGTNAAEALAAAAAAYQVGRAGLDTAWVGTGAAIEAYDVAKTALETSWLGTNSSAALAAASAASNVARTGLDTAWVGTAAATAAQSMASAAYSVALPALNTAWVGTSAASAAGITASAAYTIASAGTIGSQTLLVSSGTVAFDMDGQVYQTVSITGDTAVVVTNQKPHTANSVQGITARLISNGSPHNITCDNFEWMTDPLTTIGSNKTVFLSLTSFGSTPSQITASALIEDTRFLSIDANSIQAYVMGRSALETSWTGTGIGQQANAVSKTALTTSWVGTTAANYALTQTGTLNAVLSLVLSGSHSFFVSSTGAALDTRLFVNNGVIVAAAPPLPL